MFAVAGEQGGSPLQYGHLAINPNTMRRVCVYFSFVAPFDYALEWKVCISGLPRTE
jgi:hypothetical protein